MSDPPRFRLLLLGTADLTNGDGRTVQSVVAQPKRFALLAYLAAARPFGPRSRDELVALLWPESDSIRARNSLSQALSYLRRSLGEDALSASLEAVQLREDVVAVDVADFEVASAADRAEEALALYRGEFLAGFHVTDAPEFERWMESERARFRHAGRDLAFDHSRAVEANGDAAASVRWARRALEIAPHDEAVLRRLIALLNACGDRAGAVEQYDSYAASIAAELELTPAPETRALIEAVRSRQTLPFVDSVPTEAGPAKANDERGGATSDAARADRVPVLQSPQPTTSGRSFPRRPGFNRPSRWIASAAALVIGGVALAALTRSATRTPDDARVLVAAFENRTGDPHFEMLGYVVQDWITQGLQQTGLVNVVDPLSAAMAAREARADSSSGSGLELAGAMARAAGARVVVWGAVYERSDSLRFRAQITDMTSERLLATLDPAVSSVSEPTLGAERLRSRIAGAIAALMDRRIASQTDAGSRPPSFEAYREYVLGLEDFQAEREGEAIPHFAAAARLDTSFTLPLIWSAFAFGNLGRAAEEDSVVAILAARRNRLTAVEAYATDYFLAKTPADRLAAAAAAARLSPGSTWSWNAGSLALAMNRPGEALRYFEPIDPEHGWVRQWEWYWSAHKVALHQLGMYEQQLKMGRRFQRVAPHGLLARFYQTSALIGLGRIAEAENSARALPFLESDDLGSPAEALLETGREMRVHGHREAAARMFDLGIQWLDSPPAQTWLDTKPDREAAFARLETDRGAILYNQGNWEKCYTLFSKALSEWDGKQSTAEDAEVFLGLLAAQRKDVREANQWIEIVRHQGDHMMAAEIAATLHDRQQMLDLLKQAYEDGISWDEVHRAAAFDAYRQDPEFQAITRPRG